MKNKFFYILITLLSLSAVAQKRTTLRGHIISGTAVVTDAYVINKSLGQETISDVNGNFSIPAQVGDKLVVYSKRTELREFFVTKSSFKENPYTLEVKPMVTELEEVVISDSVQLAAGFPRMAPKYTPAEAKWRAGSGTYHMDQGVMIHGDAIINRLTGRRAALKSALTTEKKEATMEAITNDVELVELIEQDLEIPSDYVRGFLFYLVEDKEFADALKANNAELSKTRLISLAETYKQNLKSGE